MLSYHSCGQGKPCLSSHAAYCDHVWEANFVVRVWTVPSASSLTM
ncbi:hypothetical protein GCM10011335_48590 [Aureimonas glaciei]|uniref:Uncharacterized protein n=1 Tax=Aureimonas glaciei TaxID=1776957 RepID=A0A916YCL5_9HYPH|nr:hypothetical protein GCM10011335_48590 [Aureimonas glaciei]